MEFKPFSDKDYGYNEMRHVVGSWAIWALVTYSSVKINTLDGLGVLAASLVINEKEWGLPDVKQGNGASYAHNIQAGFCWYHYFLKNNPDGFWGSWAELAGDSYAILGEEGLQFNHTAHFRGASIGMGIGFALDMLRGLRVPTLGRWTLVPAAIIAFMYANQHEEDLK